MKKTHLPFSFLFLAALLCFAALTPNAAAQNNGEQYCLTVGRYAETDDLAAAVVAEFGPGAVVADWDDIVANFTGQAEQFCNQIGLLNYTQNAMCVRGGNGWYNSTRHYFIERHNHNKPSGFMAHDHLDNYQLSLGSWSSLNHRIAVKLPLTLKVEQLHSNTVGLATLSGMDPGNNMVVGYSFAGAGPTTMNFGFDLKLTMPIEQLAMATANAAGVAQAQRLIPPSIPPGTAIWIQAVELNGATPIRISAMIAAHIQ